MCKLLLKDLILPKFDEQNEDIIKNTLPLEIGKDYTQNIRIQDGFYLLKTDYLFNTPTQMQSKQIQKSFVITFCLKGDSSYINQDKEIINFRQGYTSISSFAQIDGFREYNDEQTLQVRLVLKEDFLKRNLKQSLLEKYFYNDKKLDFISFLPTSLSSQFLLNDILNCDLKGEIGSIYIQAKALELLSLQLNKLQENKDDIFLDNYDKDAIYRAKEILIQNIQNPPSIVQLAKQVHLNEVKLKKGFKQIFNTSPYKLLLNYRMNEAKTLIESGQYNINEIAQIVGYKYTSSFTNAFFKECGVLPKDLLKNKKYY